MAAGQGITGESLFSLDAPYSSLLAEKLVIEQLITDLVKIGMLVAAVKLSAGKSITIY